MKKSYLNRTSPLTPKASMKRSRLRRKSKTPKAKAKALAWGAFSAYIRQRDPLCVTCGAPTKQSGHFIDGRRNAVLFSEEGVHGQCAMCNVYLHGNKVQYWLFMEKTYGRPTIDRLIAESKLTIQYKKSDYERIESQYRQKLQELLDAHN